MARWIDTPEDLRTLADQLAGDPIVALDSESDSLHHFREKVCLIQIATVRGEIFLVDPLAVRDLSPLGPVLADPGIEKVLHGADYDVACFARDFGFRAANLFDTMIAARILGWPEVGLAAVVEREFGCHLCKGPQTADWSRRPVAPDLEQYAAADVVHLIALRDRIVAHLRSMGREHWAREEAAAVSEAPAALAVPAPADFRKARGARDLDGRGLAVLRELFAVREAVALHLDRPRFKVVSEDVLVTMAFRLPLDETELARVPGLPRPVAHHARQWLDAVLRGLEGPEEDWRLGPPPDRTRPDPVVTDRIGRLRAWRNEAAQRFGLDPGLLLPQRLIIALAVAGPGTVEELAAIEGLRAWRVEALGSDLLAILQRR